MFLAVAFFKVDSRRWWNLLLSLLTVTANHHDPIPNPPPTTHQDTQCSRALVPDAVAQLNPCLNHVSDSFQFRPVLLLP